MNCGSVRHIVKEIMSLVDLAGPGDLAPSFQLSPPPPPPLMILAHCNDLNLNLNVTVLITKNCLSGTGKVSGLFMSNSDWIGRDL